MLSKEANAIGGDGGGDQGSDGTTEQVEGGETVVSLQMEKWERDGRI